MVYFHACLFSPHMCYNYWFTVYMNANGADLHLPNCRQNLLIDIPETCFTFTKSKTNFVNWFSRRLLYFLWWIQISFFPTISYTPVLCFAHILSCRQNVSGGHLLMSMLELIKFIPCISIKRMVKVNLVLGLLAICFISLTRTKVDICAGCAASLLTLPKWMCEKGALWFGGALWMSSRGWGRKLLKILHFNTKFQFKIFLGRTCQS